MVKGLSDKDAAILLAQRHEPYGSVADLHDRTGLPSASLERLAEADAFACLGLSRREALWQVRALPATELPLFALREHHREPATTLTPMTPGREVVEDYRAVGLTLRHHPVAFLRADLAARCIVPTGELRTARNGARLTVAGIVLVRQKPGSAKGVLFVTIEDETSHANLVVWPSLFDQRRFVILSASMIACRGRVQRVSDVIHVVAEEIEDLSPLLRSVGQREDFPHHTGRGDEARHGGAPDPRGIAVKTRDFR